MGCAVLIKKTQSASFRHYFTKVPTFSCRNGYENIASPLLTPVASPLRVPCEHLKSLLLNKSQSAFMIDAQPHEDRHFVIFHCRKRPQARSPSPYPESLQTHPVLQSCI